MKQCFLVGVGMGAFSCMTLEAVKRIENASVVAGAERVLEVVGEDLVNGEWFCSYNSEEIAEKFESFISLPENAGRTCCAVFSGDSGFYSGAGRLREILVGKGWNVELVPGLTSAQVLASRLGRDWHEWELVSAHGVDCEIPAVLHPVSRGKPVFLLTGGRVTAKSVVDYLLDRELLAVVTVADRLSYCDERIVTFDMRSVESDAFVRDYESLSSMGLSVVLVEGIPAADFEVPRGSGALPDDAFVRSQSKSAGKGVPMSKRAVRSLALSLLSVRDGDVVWDVGAGTGAVSIDLARCAGCSVYSVEKKENAVALLRENRAKFCALNMEIVEGKAPAALEQLPPPDAVFVGGSDGNLVEIAEAVFGKNQLARVVVACATPETLSECVTYAGRYKREFEVVQVSVAESARAGKVHLMKAENPVCLVTLMGR